MPGIVLSVLGSLKIISDIYYRLFYVILTATPEVDPVIISKLQMRKLRLRERLVQD